MPAVTSGTLNPADRHQHGHPGACSRSRRQVPNLHSLRVMNGSRPTLHCRAMHIASARNPLAAGSLVQNLRWIAPRIAPLRLGRESSGSAFVPLARAGERRERPPGAAGADDSYHGGGRSKADHAKGYEENLRAPRGT